MTVTKIHRQHIPNDFENNELLNVVLQHLISEPVINTEGKIYYNSFKKIPFYSDGVEWIPFFGKPVQYRYTNEIDMLADQPIHNSGYLYYRSDEDVYYEYLGTTAGTMVDYNPFGGSGIVPVITASNGLEKIGSDIRLGNQIIGDPSQRYVDISEWSVSDYSSFLITTDPDSWNIGSPDPNANLFIDKNFSGIFNYLTDIRGAQVSTEAYSGDSAAQVSANMGGGVDYKTSSLRISSVSGAKYRDEIFLKGIDYDGDYEANFTARTLITKQYVDGLISGVSYLSLIDTNDISYTGKSGYVPVVNNESQLVLEPLPNANQDGLISGGIVQWTGTGYNFNVSSALARFQGVFPLQSDFDILTLTTADGTNPRIDLFILQILFDGDGIPNGMEADFITGTPSATPAKPQINPSTQIELTQVLVPALSTTPTLNEEIVYDENTEWIGTSSGTGTANFASAVNPYQGTVSVETTNIQNGFYIQFNNGSEIDRNDYQTLGFFLDLKASMPANQNLYITFLNGSLAPVSGFTLLNFDKSSTIYQFIGIALSSISFTSDLFQYIRFSFVRTGGSPTYSGYFLDIVKFEGGINPPTQFGTFLSLGDTPNSYSGQAGKTVAVKADESGLEFITGGGGASTFLALTDTPSTYVAQANKFPRVNGGETALVFDTVSPYDLKQEGAANGQVLTWVSANSRYEPVTPSGGGSQWTAGTGFIYRDGQVVVGRTTLPTNATFAVQNKGLAPQTTFKYIQFLKQDGTEHFSIQESGVSIFNYWNFQVGAPTTNISNQGATFKGPGTIAGHQLFRILNGSDLVAFEVLGDRSFQHLATTFKCGSPTTNLAAVGATFKGGASSAGSQIFKIINNTDVTAFQVEGDGKVLTGSDIRVGNPTTNLANFGSTFKGRVANDVNQVFRVLNSADTILFEIAGLGQITYRDGGNHVFGTSTGSKLGTSTSQKLAFWNKTPIIQPTTGITGAALAGGGGTTITDTHTFGGYTLQQIAAALINTGLLA